MRHEPDWKGIAAEASTAASHDITPLQVGQPIAWATYRMGFTNGLSSLHYVGAIDSHGHAETLCGDEVPDPVTRLPLSPRLARVLDPCGYCAAEHAHQEHAA